MWKSHDANLLHAVGKIWDAESMTAQPDLWTPTDDGHADALDALPASVVTALQACFLMTKGGPSFSSDSVWGHMSLPTREAVALHPNAVPALFTYYSRAGKIERTGAYVVSQRKAARGRRIPVWRWPMP
jgi:hypothetical protein